MSSRPAILHVITGLGQGGAERQLANLVGHGRHSFRSGVFSIRSPGVMQDILLGYGASVFSGEAEMSASVSWPIALRRTVRLWHPDLVVGWMYHGNLGALFSRTLGFKRPIVWNVRHSVHDLSREKWGTRSAIRFGALVSGSASKIIYNSEIAAAQHEKLGYAREGRVVLPNGFDLERFKPNPAVRMKLRDSLGIRAEDLVIGVVGRSHPMKNHVGWVKAFAKLARANQSLQCIMLGVGVDDPFGAVAQEVRKAGLLGRVRLLPATDSPEDMYPVFDLLVLPSAFGEGVPNVVGEAMACGVPAAVTDVGDARVLVGETGFVIPGAQPEELAEGVASAIRVGQGGLAERGRCSRERVSEHYSLEAMGERYYSLLRKTLDEHRA